MKGTESVQAEGKRGGKGEKLITDRVGIQMALCRTWERALGEVRGRVTKEREKKHKHPPMASPLLLHYHKTSAARGGTCIKCVPLPY